MGKLRRSQEPVEDSEQEGEEVSYIDKVMDGLERVVDVIAPEFEDSHIHNGQLEFILLVWCVLDSELRARLWPRLIDDHFASDSSRNLFRRLQTLNHSGRDWPSLSTLSMDPALPSESQVQIKALLSKADQGSPLMAPSIKISKSKEVPLETAADIEGHVYELLESYRVTRLGLEKMVAAVTEVSEDEDFDPFTGPEIVERTATEILSVRGQESISESLMHFGADTSDEDARKRESELSQMMEDRKPRFKTGIASFDEKAGGFQPGEVCLMGANTGGGKTAMALSMGVNMARMGTSSAMLQLELSMGQMDERLSSHLARVDSEVIRSGNIPDKIQKRIRRSWDRFHRECEEANAKFTIYTPSSQTVEACEMLFKQYPYKVWFIDYVNLINLGGKDGDLRGWEKLSVITKLFKGIAKKYNIAVVPLVQVNIDKDGNIDIRYAKAMKEDADIVLAWNLNDEARAEGVVWVQHLKARQYEPFDFPVRVNLEHFMLSSFDSSKRHGRRLGKKRSKESSEIDLSQEDTALNTFDKKEKPLPDVGGSVKAVGGGVEPVRKKVVENRLPLWDNDVGDEYDD